MLHFSGVPGSVRLTRAGSVAAVRSLSQIAAAGIGCMDCKKWLFEGVKTELGQIRARAEALRADPARVDAILARGAGEARQVAGRTMQRVRERLGLRAAGA